MQQIQCVGYDQPLRIADAPNPAPDPGEIVISVRAAGVNYVDALLVTGRYQLKTPPPFTPGSEVAGTVAALGAGVNGLTVGQRVFAMTSAGFASHNVIRADRAFPIPVNLSDAQAASFVQSYCTAWYALNHRGRARAGEWLLVLGAAGGVGAAAIDVGKAMGLRVIAAASSAERLASCRALGADELINYGECTPAALKDRAREISGGGVDLVYDPVGAALAEPCLRALGYDGRYLVIGFAGGPIPALPVNQILLRNRQVVGVDWGGWLRDFPDRQAELLNTVVARIAAGDLHPPAPAEYPFARANEALADLEHRRVHGKIVLVP